MENFDDNVIVFHLEKEVDNDGIEDNMDYVLVINIIIIDYIGVYQNHVKRVLNLNIND